MARHSSTAPRPFETGFAIPRRPGFSLTELLVACGIAMVVMASLAALFGIFSRALSQTQATSALTVQMRSVAWQLRQDLAGLTVPEVAPTLEPAADAGYFELIEGPLRDTTNAFTVGATPTPTANLAADIDDILLFTTRSAGSPFVGRFTNSGTPEIQESRVAEVAWFLRTSSMVGSTQLYTLRRRQLLVVNYLGRVPFLDTGNYIASEPKSVFPSNDLSVQYDRTNVNCSVPNTLGDLTKRENRFLRSNSVSPSVFNFPFICDLGLTEATLDDTTSPKPNRVGEDIVLANVIAFDVRVFDPLARAQLVATPMTTRYPGDPRYETGDGAFGAYVDLGSHASGGMGTSPVTPLTAPPNVKSKLTVPTYDTWSLHYEFNNIDEDGQWGIDSAVNGNDDNGDDLADNPAEFDAPPPYAVPLRGIEVRIRCYEPTSRQVRQITVRHTFLRR